MLKINNLTVGFKKDDQVIKAVNNIDFSVKKGQIVGLVGESGCGKSTALFSMMGLVPSPGEIMGGEIFLDGKNLADNNREQWRKLRGKDISMIFQDPMTALNPAYPVGEQIREVLKSHRVFRDQYKGFLNKRKVKQLEKERVISLMEEVRIPSAKERYNDYPHQFSGGMQQRILVAMAIACEPKILLADEPTTALDVTIQAQVLDVLKRINKTHDTGIVLVTHDLSVASEFCDEIAVMYAGKIVERGPTRQVIDQPEHPYTQGLLNSIPVISEERKEITPIKGNVIDLLKVGKGCGFYNRCPYMTEQCKEYVPMVKTSEEKEVRCILFQESGEKVVN